MKLYQVPKGYESFEAIETLFKEKLPEKFKIVEAKKGGKMPMFTAGKMVGTIKIRQNSYNGMIISLTSTDGNINDNISIVDYVPSWIVEFLRTKVLGALTNLIFPAIYGTSTKIYEVVDDIIMKNIEANQMDTSFTTSMKNMFKGQAMTQIKKTSVNALEDVVNDASDSIKEKIEE